MAAQHHWRSVVWTRKHRGDEWKFAGVFARIDPGEIRYRQWTAFKLTLHLERQGFQVQTRPFGSGPPPG